MNLIDYVVRYGGQSFSERPPNEADSLIFSELSYLNFSGMSLETAPKRTLKDLAAAHKRLVDDTLLPRANEKLLLAIQESRRFSSVTAGYFCEHNDERSEVRFSAVTFDFGAGTYVAFRGTDVTLLGWKEDFNMAFNSKIPSQRLAAEYLRNVARKTEGKLIVGGHSKGGNLALYAAVSAPPAVRARIEAVYNHDGPGFYKSIFKSAAYLELADRVHKTVPHDSLIGILLFHSDSYKVVESRSVLIGQHNPFAWTVRDENGFKELPQTTRNSRRTERALASWIAEMSETERKRFVEALFKVVEGSGATKVPEFKRGFFTKIRGMKRAYRALPPASRSVIRSKGKRLLKLWFRAVRKDGDEI